MTIDTMIEQNRGLVVYTMQKYFPDLLIDEDLFQTGMIGLWCACKEYKPNGGEFSTFAVRCIRNEIGKELNGRRRKKRCGKTIALETPLNEDGFTIADTMPGDVDITWVDFQGLLEVLTERQREVLTAQLSGYSQKEIAKRYGVSGSAINASMECVRKKAREYI